jgi:hypothetical protein
MSYELIAIIEFAVGIYATGIFIALVLWNVHELKSRELHHHKVAHAILWPAFLFILILVYVWVFIDFQAKRLAAFIVLQSSTEAKSQKAQKMRTKAIRPVKVDVPQQPTDTDVIYSNIEYVVKSRGKGGWYTIKVNGYSDEVKVRLTKTCKTGEDKFADALKRWIDSERDVIQAV